ncbi:hypothetical protein ABZ897_00680 [Nonomuraea sp. NPDC046802]
MVGELLGKLLKLLGRELDLAFQVEAGVLALVANSTSRSRLRRAFSRSLL